MNGNQIDLELGYRVAFSPTESLQLNVAAQFQPGHDADASPEGFFGFKYTLAF